MLLSDRHRFVFIHVPKCAGDSITQALWHLADVTAFDANQPPKHLSAADVRRYYFAATRRSWDDYVRFAFVRNPWDQVHSWYHFCRSRHPDPNIWPSWSRQCAAVQPLSFREYVVGLPEHWKWLRPGRCLLATDGSNLMTFIGRYESLASDWKRVMNQIGLRGLSLPHKNRGPDKPAYQDAYDRAGRDLVARHFADDIERFDYQF